MIISEILGSLALLSIIVLVISGAIWIIKDNKHINKHKHGA